MENQDLEVILGHDSKNEEDRFMVDSHFLISQSDYVRAKFHFDGVEDNPPKKSIHFPNVDRETWDDAMHYLKPAAWLALTGKSPLDRSVLKKIVPFYVEYCFDSGIEACNSYIVNHLRVDDFTYYEYALAAIAIGSELKCAAAVKELIKEKLGLIARFKYIYTEDAAVVFTCFEMDGGEDERFLRRSAAHVLALARLGGFAEQFGIRTEALENFDFDEIKHYLSKDAIQTILSACESSPLHYVTKSPSNKRRRVA